MTLHVESVGHGPPLVLLHGWGMHGGLWGALPSRLAQRHRVHVVDLPGHGHSSGTIAHDLPGMVTAVRGAIASDAAVTLVGWSLGAMLAMQWALDAPEGVARLILTGATPKFVRSADWPHAMDETSLVRFADELAVAYRLTLQRFVSLQLQGSDHARSTLAGMRHCLFARGEPSQDALRTGLAILRTTDLRAVVAGIREPALVIAGDRDTLTPVGASRWLAEHLPHATLQVISGAAHVPFLSHPEAFAAGVLSFLDAS